MVSAVEVSFVGMKMIPMQQKERCGHLFWRCSAIIYYITTLWWAICIIYLAENYIRAHLHKINRMYSTINNMQNHCQPDEPMASLVTTNRITNVYGFLVVIMLLMYSVLIVCILLGIKLLLLQLPDYYIEYYSINCTCCSPYTANNLVAATSLKQCVSVVVTLDYNAVTTCVCMVQIDKPWQRRSLKLPRRSKIATTYNVCNIVVTSLQRCSIMLPRCSLQQMDNYIETDFISI